MSDSAATPLLFESELAVLIAAEHVLEAISKRAETGVYELEPHDAANRGRLAEVAKGAGDSVFDVLNCASSRCRDRLASRELERRFRTEVDELEEVEA